MTRHNVFRDDRVHILNDLCSTCVLRPGNLMHLKSGRVKGMVDDAIRDGSTIVCHQTLDRDDVENAGCRGFWNSYRDRVQALQLAERLGMVEFDPQPPKR